MTFQHLVLVVDDDPDVREAIADTLLDAGYSVETSANGQEALSRLTSEPLPSLILLDLMMPIMNGYQFLYARTNDARIAAIPVVIVTAHRGAHVAGIGVPVLYKPVDSSGLVKLVNQFC